MGVGGGKGKPKLAAQGQEVFTAIKVHGKWTS